MKLRGLLLLCVALAGLGLSSNRGASAAPSVDDQILHLASTRLHHDGSRATLRWLHRQPAVSSAALGPDSRTLAIHFVDGVQAAVLPVALTAIHLPFSLRPHLRSGAPVRASGGKALVLEPFATELGLGPNAGDPEVQSLKQAGFQVDQLYDTNVTVSSMNSMSNYNVVYMHTHSGQLPGADAVIATGQLVSSSNDTALATQLQNGSVIKIDVSGAPEKQEYYGITSTFIQNYMGQFPSSSLIFFNGCDLLQATKLWQTLSAKGVGVMVTWDKEATSKDNYLTGAAFFNQMAQGMSVSAAINALKAGGLGTSDFNNTTATLGSVGDGTITLARAAVGVPAPVTPTPLPTAAPTATPAGPPTPTPTPTTVPGPPLTATLTHRVVPGAHQVIHIHSTPDTIIHIAIAFPNGDQRHATTATDASGNARFAFLQHASRIAYKHVFASVTVQAVHNGGTSTTTLSYRIGWSHLDVSIEPRQQSAGRQVYIWVHTAVHAPVTVSLHFPAGTTRKLAGKTGRHGWVSFAYRVGSGLRKPNNGQVIVHASAQVGSSTYSSRSTFTIT